MAVETVRSAPAAQGLVNKYMLPKVALTLIGIASLAGVYLTMRTHGAAPLEVFLRWLHLISLATLTGGVMWWAFFLRESGAALTLFYRAQEARFRTIACGALVGLILTAPHLTAFGRWTLRWSETPAFVVSLAALGMGILLTLILLARRRRTDDVPVQRTAVFLAFGGLAGAVLATAVLDARLTFPGSSLAQALRGVHLLAFSLWFGGAVWNVFVAGPAAKEHLSLQVVGAAAGQLERFRWVVRFALPALLVTGLLQSLPYTGLNPEALLYTPFGRLIALKLGLVVALVGIFITCPLWRACSPIKGICDLEELNAPVKSEPSRRLDNRGKGCAGFVHIQRELEHLSPSGTLEVLSSDAISWWELPAWLEQHRYTLLEKERKGRFLWRYFRFVIQKPSSPSQSPGR